MNTERPEVAAAAWADATIAIIGAGQAGGWAAQTLRKEGFDGRIVLIGDEAHPPHERPPLSKAVLAGEAAPESTSLFKPEAFDALALDWRPNVKVTRIDRAAKRLEINGGETLAYDKLILCTGGRARTLTVPGADSAAVRTLRTIDDALALAPLLGPGKSLVVVGRWVDRPRSGGYRTQERRGRGRGRSTGSAVRAHGVERDLGAPAGASSVERDACDPGHWRRRLHLQW